jgi:hypothetical protein
MVMKMDDCAASSITIHDTTYYRMIKVILITFTLNAELIVIAYSWDRRMGAVFPSRDYAEILFLWMWNQLT